MVPSTGLILLVVARGWQRMTAGPLRARGRWRRKRSARNSTANRRPPPWRRLSNARKPRSPQHLRAPSLSSRTAIQTLLETGALFAAVHESGTGRYCCKSLFAPLIKNSLGCTRDFRVKMWGTSSPDGKLTGDLGNAIESTEIDGRRSRRPLAGKLSPDDFRLLQQYRPAADSCGAARCPIIRGGGRADPF